MPIPILTTKPTIPQMPGGLIPRQRLVKRLGAVPVTCLTLVCAPAGFGKTTLIGEWIRASRHPVARLSIDPADNDVRRFWAYVIAALPDLCRVPAHSIRVFSRGTRPHPLLGGPLSEPPGGRARCGSPHQFSPGVL